MSLFNKTQRREKEIQKWNVINSCQTYPQGVDILVPGEEKCKSLGNTHQHHLKYSLDNIRFLGIII